MKFILTVAAGSKAPVPVRVKRSLVPLSAMSNSSTDPDRKLTFVLCNTDAPVPMLSGPPSCKVPRSSMVEGVNVDRTSITLPTNRSAAPSPSLVDWKLLITRLPPVLTTLSLAVKLEVPPGPWMLMSLCALMAPSRLEPVFVMERPTVLLAPAALADMASATMPTRTGLAAEPTLPFVASRVSEPTLAPRKLVGNPMPVMPLARMPRADVSTVVPVLLLPLAMEFSATLRLLATR